MKLNLRKMKRSGTEFCPICKFHGRLVEHHINGREIRNFQAPFNIVWICPNCHDKIHSNDIINVKWVRTSSGKELFFEFS